jgi:hypothetical protein
MYIFFGFLFFAVIGLGIYGFYLMKNPGKEKESASNAPEVTPEVIPDGKPGAIPAKSQTKRNLSCLTVLGALTLILVAIVSWYLYGPCGTLTINDNLAKASKILTEWDDQNSVASQTPRIALANQISELQRIRREMVDFETPVCLGNWKFQVTSYMDDAIKGYLAFMGNELSDTYFTNAKEHINNATSEVDLVKQCAPICGPDHSAP